MPLDGNPHDWEPEPERRPERRQVLYTVMPRGTRKGQRKWQLDVLRKDGWMPIISFYAKTKTDAYCVASWALRQTGYLPPL